MACSYILFAYLLVDYVFIVIYVCFSLTLKIENVNTKLVFPLCTVITIAVLFYVIIF